MSVLDPVVELVRGLWTTLKMLSKKPVTFQYPEQKRRYVRVFVVAMS